jgi:hypothetical protein
MPEPQDLCVSPAKGPIAMSQGETSSQPQSKPEERSTRMTARVGKPAPDFEANAFAEGGFRNIKLSDYKGQWVVLCFYPGDFTFV